LLRTHFAPRPVPALLCELVAFDTAGGGFFSGYFELTDSTGRSPANELLGPFDGGVEKFGAEFDRELAIFGLDSDGSTYALWTYGDRTPEQAPVVYVNSEGDGSRVVADDLRAFLGLLLLDVSDVGRCFFDDEPVGRERHGAFVAWAAAHGIRAPDDPDAVAELAASRHPDFDAWLTERWEQLW